MLPVISASRRMDLPAFHARSFMEHVRAGRILVPNPWSGVVQQQSLRPQEIAGILFWTRLPGPLLPHMDELIGHYGKRLRFTITVTGMPAELEARSPAPLAAIRDIQCLATLLGPEAISWRFDPVLLSNLTQESWWLKQFERLLVELAPLCTEVIVSWVDLYHKTVRNLATVPGLELPEQARSTPGNLIQALAKMSHNAGLPLRTCCEPTLLGLDGIEQAHCIDAAWFEAANGWLPGTLTSAPNREGCGCCLNRDIGVYDSCSFGCVYCYANRVPLNRAERDPWPPA